MTRAFGKRFLRTLPVLLVQSLLCVEASYSAPKVSGEQDGTLHKSPTCQFATNIARVCYRRSVKPGPCPKESVLADELKSFTMLEDVMINAEERASMRRSFERACDYGCRARMHRKPMPSAQSTCQEVGIIPVLQKSPRSRRDREPLLELPKKR